MSPVPAPPGAVPPDSRLAIVDFLRARIEEDEAKHRECLPFLPEGRSIDITLSRWDNETEESWTKHVRPYDPNRALRECQAKRLLLDQFTASPVLTPYAASLLGILALPYEDHPDFREEWKP